MFMIAQMYRLTAAWHYSAPHVRRLVLTYLLRSNGKRMTGKEEHYCLLILTMNTLCYRLLYRPQLVSDGNMKLVHQMQKRPEDDVSLSDGEMFIVKRAPYAKHLANAPQRQPVSSHNK
jgi:hypothetical protein